MLPSILSSILGFLGGGFNAYTVAQQNKQKAIRAEDVRAQLQQTITRLRNPEYSGLNSAASREYTKAQEAATANNAAAGISGSGAARTQANDLLAQAMANLAQFKLQDQANREAQVGELLKNEAFSVPSSDSVNPGLEALLAGIAGGAGSLGQTLAAQQANPLPEKETAQVNSLASLFQPGLGLGATSKMVQDNSTPFTNALLSLLGRK